MVVMGEGREGDWECSGCKNRNYAFRSFCNRCKQPRLLVDNKTPADSKWLPRIGDWICTGCTNNNYASREKCKKCGQPKEIAAIPAIALHGAAFSAFSQYSARSPSLLDLKMHVWPNGDGGAPQQPLPLSSAWSLGGPDKYGVIPPSAWPLGGSSPLPYQNPLNQLLAIPKSWRNGDWICKCGFHNYSSRAQCKKCNALPPAPGTKRLASEELVHDLDNKRPNVGQHSYPSFEHMARPFGDPNMGLYASFSGIGSPLAPSWQFPLQFTQQVTASSLLGKGAKQWRDGDWMCMNCDNHNYASRAQCNRCKTQRDVLAQPVDAM